MLGDQPVSTQKDAVSTPASTARGRQTHNVLRAALWMGVALLCFVLTAVTGRAAGEKLSAMHMVFYRNLISLIVLLIVFQVMGIRLSSLRTRQPILNVLRAWAHFAGQWSWMSALLMIPLVELFSLEFTAPLWVAILAPLILGERLTIVRVIAAALGFIGALIIIQPGSASMSLGTLLAVTCALMFALNTIGTRYLTRADGPLTILMFMVVNHTVLAFILGYSTLTFPDNETLPWVVLLGLSSLAAHYGLARALSYADAVVVAPMDFLRLPLIAVIGVLVYNEQLNPIVLLGTAVVLAGNIFNLWGEHRRQPG